MFTQSGDIKVENRSHAQTYAVTDGQRPDGRTTRKYIASALDSLTAVAD